MSGRRARPRPAGLYWSLPDAARRLGILLRTLKRRIERGELVALPGDGDREPVIAATELRRYEAGHRRPVLTPLGLAPASLLRQMEKPELHFPLVKLEVDADDRHALQPGAEGGPALCGLEPEVGDWYLVGFARRWFLIPCSICRERAAAIVNGRNGEDAG